MNDYTTDTMQWLDQRFKLTDENGIYVAHQPIYGFRQGHSEPGMVSRYMITYQIMRALSHLRFSSFLDVGGAEGYKSALVRSIFGAQVRSADLSAEACARAKEIFGVEGEPIDIHHLPYADNQFDVVLCSETLEHVPDIVKAANELLRVSRKALVITVPREPVEVVEQNIREKIPHAHIHALDTDSFDFLKPNGVRVIARKYHYYFLKFAAEIVDAVKSEDAKDYPPLVARVQSFLLPVFRVLFGRRSARFLVKLDDFLANRLSSYGGMCFIILKDSGCYREHPEENITAQQIIDFKVPFHYL
jgi:ubiquinone/menaquinone biosynthesis C-methylase UbiE